MSAKPSRQIIAKLTLVIVSTLLTLLALEIVFRIYFAFSGTDIRNYRPSFVYSPTDEDRSRFTSHPFLPYAPRPFDTRKMFPYREEIKQTVETDYSTNSLGFRTPERPFEKPPKTKRIITLGGSTTFDGPTNDQTWSALLEKRLNETYAKSGYKIEVINLAVDMASSPYSLVNLCFIGVSFQPDLVISYDGVNDSWIIGYQGLMPDYRSLMDKYDPRERTLQSKLPKWLFASYLVSFISHKIDASIDSKPDLVGQVLGRKVALLKPSENQLEGIQYFKRNLKLMRGISNEYGAKFLAATSHWVHPSDKVVAMNEDMRRFFEQEHIDFLDLDRLLPHDDYSIHVDAVHWSLKGEEMMAERWEAKIIETDALGLNAAR